MFTGFWVHFIVLIWDGNKGVTTIRPLPVTKTKITHECKILCDKDRQRDTLNKKCQDLPRAQIIITIIIIIKRSENCCLQFMTKVCFNSLHKFRVILTTMATISISLSCFNFNVISRDTLIPRFFSDQVQDSYFCKCQNYSVLVVHYNYNYSSNYSTFSIS